MVAYPCLAVAWKSEVRVMGIDDAPFQRGDREVHVTGVVTRASSGYVEAVSHDTVRGDGDDATDVLARMVSGSRLYANLGAVLTQNVMVGGFNTIDLEALHAAVDRPVVGVIRGCLDWDAVRIALRPASEGGNVPDGPAKWGRIAPLRERAFRHGNRVLVPVGLPADEAQELVDLATVRGILPEPLRIAHLIGAGWVLGQSRGQ